MAYASAFVSFACYGACRRVFVSWMATSQRGTWTSNWTRAGTSRRMWWTRTIRMANGRQTWHLEGQHMVNGMAKNTLEAINLLVEVEALEQQDDAIWICLLFRISSQSSPEERHVFSFHGLFLAGLGGRWGPYRLDVGQKLVQVSEDSKKGLDEETKRKTQEILGAKQRKLCMDLPLDETTWNDDSSGFDRGVVLYRMLSCDPGWQMMLIGRGREWFGWLAGFRLKASARAIRVEDTSAKHCRGNLTCESVFHHPLFEHNASLAASEAGGDEDVIERRSSICSSERFCDISNSGDEGHFLALRPAKVCSIEVWIFF